MNGNKYTEFGRRVKSAIVPILVLLLLLVLGNSHSTLDILAHADDNCRTMNENHTLLYSIGGGPMCALGDQSQLALPAGVPLRFDIASGGCWYGHGFAHRQPWPLNREPIVNDAFAVNNAQSPIWLCSAGYAIMAETDEILAVSFNAAGNGAGSGVLRVVCKVAPITVRIFHGPNLPDAQRQLLAHLGWPNQPPDASFFGDSIFCTWTQYPRCITQERILAMARAIREHGYPCSCITIDDRWESAFGELQFSHDFAEPARMVRELHELGFRVLLWVTPFVNQEAATFAELGRRRVLVPRKDGAGAALLKWWGGTAGLVDLTNPAGRDWFRRQLVQLRDDIGVDGFKIDGGDAKYQPPVADAAWHDYHGASGYADALLELFEEIAPGRCETRTVWLSQRRRIIWRQGGKDSHWGIDNGLRAMVSLALHMGLIGYDVLIPDMIPGRVQTMAADVALPTDELLVRWTEASAFMPIMQFSYFPWNYAPETEQVVLQYALLHKALEGYIHRHACNRTAPLIRPLWYDAPAEAELYSVGDEFLLGPDILAAPVLAENQAARDVVLPPGSWRDAWTGQTHGCRRIIQHPSPCPGIPIFVRAENAALFETLHRGLQAISRASIRSGMVTTTYRAGINRDLNVTG